MGEFILGQCTDIGVRKQCNQDSICIKSVQIEEQIISMAIVCDGMGGLSKGELASATVVRAFSKWFTEEMPYNKVFQNAEVIKQRWKEIVRETNRKIWNYGNENGVQLGTTVSVLLILNNQKYLIMHVGDSRIYGIEESMIQITEDHSYIAREVKRGNMTKEQAANDPRKNVLLQCVGGSRNVEPDILEGPVCGVQGFLLCSDGFRHQISEAEMYEEVSKKTIQNKKDIEDVLAHLISVCIKRGETDNISAILIRKVSDV